MIAWIIAYLTPLLLGIMIPFLMNTRTTDQNQTSVRQFRNIPVKPILGAGILILLIGLANFLTTPSDRGLNFSDWLTLSVFLAGFSLLLIATCYLLSQLGCSGNLTQGLVSFVTLLITTTVFWLDPLIESLAGNHTLRQWLINWTMNINPTLTLASNFFRDDPMRAPEMYQHSVIGVSYYAYAAWWKIMIGHLGLAVLFILMGKVYESVRRKKPSPAD